MQKDIQILIWDIITSREQIGIFKDWSEFRPVLLRQYAGPVAPNGLSGMMYPHHFTVWMPIRGDVEVDVAGEVWRASPGDWLFLPPLERRHRIDSHVHLWCAHFYYETNGPTLLPSIHHVFHLKAPGDPELKRRAMELGRVCDKHLQDCSAYVPGLSCSLTGYLAVQAAFLGWMQILLEALEREGNFRVSHSTVDPRLEKILAILDNAPLDTLPLSSALAMEADMSVRHLNRLFMDRLHITPARYFEKRRLSYAHGELAGSNCSIKSVALALGFLDQSKFSLWFKRLEGCSPSAFRSQLS